MLFFKKIIKIILIVSIGLFIYSYFQKDSLPGRGEILDSLYQEPLQLEIEKGPFQLQRGELTYIITPKYSYELYGLIVSYYDSENWLDFWHKEDPLNTKDICAIWGDNIKGDVYQNMKFSHGEFTCYAEFKRDVDSSWYSKFSGSQLSNSHLLPKNEKIYKAMKEAIIGDQIYFAGYLVDYSVESPQGRSGTRRTSTVRTDIGNGACEVVYVTDFEILKKGNALYYTIYRLSKYLIIIFFVVLVILFFKTL